MIQCNRVKKGFGLLPVMLSYLNKLNDYSGNSAIRWVALFRCAQSNRLAFWQLADPGSPVRTDLFVGHY